MKIQWNKVTWYSKIAAVVLGVLILLVGIYIGSIYQKGADALEWSQQVQVGRPITLQKVTVRPSEKQYAFVQEGNIKNNATGEVEVDDWVLLYEKPGAPALTAGLIFTTESRCIMSDTKVEFCNTTRFAQGQRVRIKGYPNAEEKIVVERLETME